MTSNKNNKNKFPALFGRRIEKIVKNDLIQVHCLFDLNHMKAMQKILPQINNPLAWSITQKLKGISAVNGERLENYTLICLEELK